MLTHHVNESERACDIIVVIFPRLCDGFTDCLETCEMDNGVDFFVPENVLHSRSVANIGKIEFHVLACDLLYSFKGFFRRVREVIAHNDIITVFEKLNYRMGADIPCSACYKNFIHIIGEFYYFLKNFQFPV